VRDVTEGRALFGTGGMDLVVRTAQGQPLTKAQRGFFGAVAALSKKGKAR